MTKLNMSEVKIIEAGNNQYLGEFLDDLPENAMLNKVITGCGGTTVALKSKHPTVICVPFQGLIKNKVEWAEKNGVALMPVYGRFADLIEDLKVFKGNKYMVTYDSLGKLTEWLDTGVSEYKILIDEAHKLVDDGAFRTDAINTVLDNYWKYSSYVFMTATPVKDKYQLPQLRKIPKYKITWENISEVNVINHILDKNVINQQVALIGYNHIVGTIDGNAHIFLNSVKSIIKIVKLLLDTGVGTVDNINIVCAKNEENQDKVDTALGDKFEISIAGKEIKKVNLYTATAFEGCDIYDSTGITYVATNGDLDHTKIDILTTLPQIAGRVRDAINKNIHRIYSESTYESYTSEEEFEQVVKAKLEEASEVVYTFKTTDSTMLKDTLKNGAATNKYLLERYGNLVVNSTALYSEMHNYNTVHSTFYVGSFETRPKVHNDVTYNHTKEALSQEHATVFKMVMGRSYSFKDLCEEYLAAKAKDDQSTIDRIEIEKPIIKEAYEKLGAAKMKSLKYRQIPIKDALISEDKLMKVEVKIVSMLGYREGSVHKIDSVRTRLQAIYDELGITDKVIPSHIKKWYTYTYKQLVDKDSGMKQTYYQILSCNINT